MNLSRKIIIGVRSSWLICYGLLVQRKLHFTYFPGATDLLSIDFVPNKNIWNETNVIRLQDSFERLKLLVSYDYQKLVVLSCSNSADHSVPLFGLFADFKN
jgi:hypothetical protein